MLRTGWVAMLLIGVGSTAMAYEHYPEAGPLPRHFAGGPGFAGGPVYGGRWDDRPPPVGPVLPAPVWHQRYWNGRAWIYVAPPPPPYYGGHWDPYLGRYVP